MKSRTTPLEVPKSAYLIHPEDNVATALSTLPPGPVVLTGARTLTLEILESVPAGHKLSVCPIEKGGRIIKYGVCIGEATEKIITGQRVHSHNMKSLHDERSTCFNQENASPQDIRYELEDFYD